MLKRNDLDYAMLDYEQELHNYWIYCNPVSMASFIYIYSNLSLYNIYIYYIYTHILNDHTSNILKRFKREPAE